MQSRKAAPTPWVALCFVTSTASCKKVIICLYQLMIMLCTCAFAGLTQFEL